MSWVGSRTRWRLGAMLEGWCSDGVVADLLSIPNTAFAVDSCQSPKGVKLSFILPLRLDGSIVGGKIRQEELDGGGVVDGGANTLEKEELGIEGHVKLSDIDSEGLAELGEEGLAGQDEGSPVGWDGGIKATVNLHDKREEIYKVRGLIQGIIRWSSNNSVI